MHGTVRIRSLMIVATGLFLAPIVLGQSVGTGSVPQSVSSLSSNPKVTCVNGKLAINAQNTTMKDLLRAVSLATGAVIEFPNEHAAERMSATIGPGPVRDVLTTLLNGSGFNYVMVGSQNDPGTLQRMILTDAEPSAQPQLAQTEQVAPPAVTATQTPANAFLYQPPAASASVPLTREVPIVPLEAPKEAVAPEALGQMMRDLAQQIRQKQQEQGVVPAPPPQNTAPPQNTPPTPPPPQNTPAPQPDTAEAPQ
jgi:hypothetical protein